MKAFLHKIKYSIYMILLTTIMTGCGADEVRPDYTAVFRESETIYGTLEPESEEAGEIPDETGSEGYFHKTGIELKDVKADNEIVMYDLNGDGIDELICQEAEPVIEESPEIKRILGVFIKTSDADDEAYDCVFWDEADMGEFLILNNGKLSHYYHYFGIWGSEVLTACSFDEQWRLEYNERYEVLDLTDAEMELYEGFPDWGLNYEEFTGEDLKCYYRITDRDGVKNLTSREEWIRGFCEDIGDYQDFRAFLEGQMPGMQ